MAKVTVQPAQLEAAASLMNAVANATVDNRAELLAGFESAGAALRCGETALSDASAILGANTQILQEAVSEFGTKLDAAAKVYGQGDLAMALAFIPKTH